MTTSTVPAAVAAFKAYMDAVAVANPALNAQTSIGIPTASRRANLLMVGDYDTGALLNPTTYSWAAIPGQSKLRYESYSLLGAIEVSDGAGGQDAGLTRLTEAYQLLGDLMTQIESDISGLINADPGVAPLTTSGSWGDLTVEMKAYGPKQNSGWGVVLTLELQVINAQLVG